MSYTETWSGKINRKLIKMWLLVARKLIWY